MKILFLDIDGVCNNYATMERVRGMLGIKPELAAKVQRIIKETNCKVVLSSTWRLDAWSRAHVRENVCHFIDVTPRFPGGMTAADMVRGKEIRDWLQRHPEVERYAILDDDSDFLPDQPLFRTTFQAGLTTAIMKKVIKYLNEETQ